MSKLKVMSCSMGGNVQNVDFLRPIIDSLGMSLTVISEWPQHDIRWHRDTWLEHLAKADIVVCPQRHTLQPAKSNNRVTQAQALGKPVLASPLQAYCEAIVHGETGYLCVVPEQWAHYLQLLRDDPRLRKKIGKAGQQSARKRYSIDVIGQQWLNLLKQVSTSAANPPAVDVIIPTWNNLPYLQECINSIKVNTDWPCNIIVVNSGTDDTANWLGRYHPDVVVHNHSERLHFSAANNIGLRLAKNPYVCFLNDDTIVAQHWLPALMHEAMKPDVAGVNPFSNCDMGWLHNEQVNVGGVNLHPGMTLQTIKPIIPQLYTQRHNKVVTDRDWLAFFCTLMPRAVIDQVGELDEDFKSGCEDLDYCIRVKKHNPKYRFVTTFDSFVFHFGGATRKNSEKFDKRIHELEDHENQQLVKRKHQELNPKTAVDKVVEPKPEPVKTASTPSVRVVGMPAVRKRQWSSIPAKPGSPGVRATLTLAASAAQRHGPST